MTWVLRNGLVYVFICLFGVGPATAEEKWIFLVLSLHEIVYDLDNSLNWRDELKWKKFNATVFIHSSE